MKLAVYDFDGTYVDIQTLPFLYKLWKQQGLNPRAHRKTWRKIMGTYLLYKLHLGKWNKQTFRSNAMALTADLFRSVEEQQLMSFLQMFHDQLQPFIPIEMKNHLQQDKQDGYHTVLLSGNYTIILEPFLEDGFDTILGSTIQTTDGLLSSKQVDIIIHNKKRELIESSFKNADLTVSKAYADSHYDLPILEAVGHPICINPDPELHEIAKSRGYQIQSISNERTI